VDLDEPVSPAGALQIAQDVARQDFEAIGAKVYYCIPLPLVSGQEKFQVNPIPIAIVSKDWGPTFPKERERYRPQVMVITTRDFKTQGELAQAIKEARPKATHIKKSKRHTRRRTMITFDNKALGSLQAFGHISEERWQMMIGPERRSYVEVLEQCEKLGIITVNWGGRKGRSFPTWEYISGYTPGAVRRRPARRLAEPELRMREEDAAEETTRRRARFRREEPELLPQEAARFQIAEILVEEAKYAEAVNELELILASTASEEVKNLARARISTIYAKMGLDEKSEGELKKIIESTTNLELKKRALMTLASLLRTQKRYDEAIAALRQVIELTQPDVMKLLQFRPEFMPGGFTLAAADPDWPIIENPGWLMPEGLNEVAEGYDLRVRPKRGYVCFFDEKGQASDDLVYALLEFGDEQTAAAAATGISAEFREDQSDRYFGAAFAASNVVILIMAERAECIPAAKWLGITLLNALPGRLQAKPPKPRPLPVGINPNEVAAIGALRSLMAGQEEFRMADIIDQDTDGAGEYGFFQELCGTIAPPGYAAPVSPGFFDPVFGVINASGVASKGGYYFRIFLPGPDGGPAVAEVSGANSATARPGAINSRENRWTGYAWPMDYARTGSRAFVINQAGNVFATAAMVTTYDETAVMPGANAAYLVGTVNLSGALADGVGVDGNTWHPVE